MLAAEPARPPRTAARPAGDRATATEREPARPHQCCRQRSLGAQQRQGPTSAGPEDFDELLASIGLAAASGRRSAELSGGEQQRLAVACALAGKPELIILDEPTASLDRTNATTLVEVLRGVTARGATMVIATHDPLVIDAADTLAQLDHGRRIR